MNLPLFESLFDVGNIDGLYDYSESGMYSKKCLDVCVKKYINEKHVKFCYISILL